jgi:hypothetical protein
MMLKRFCSSSKARWWNALISSIYRKRITAFEHHNKLLSFTSEHIVVYDLMDFMGTTVSPLAAMHVSGSQSANRNGNGGRAGSSHTIPSNTPFSENFEEKSEECRRAQIMLT